MSRIEEALRKVAAKNPPKTEVRTPQADETGHYTPAAQGTHAREAVPPSGTEALLDVVPLTIDNPVLATALEKKTAIVEEYNKLRSSVIALTKGETFQNTLLITSTASEEGKSITALNLAISLAKEQDHTVLLVDADLRRPTLHKLLGIQPEVGLIDCLKDELPLEKALIKTGIGKLVVLPAGKPTEDPIDLLSSNRMKAILKELKDRYPERYVIFDTSPAHPFADARILGSLVDAILMVVREGKADKADLFKTLDDFKDRNLLGIVYNDAHQLLKKQDYYYY